MFAVYLTASALNVFVLGIAGMVGIPAWLPITSGLLCLLGAYGARSKKGV